MINKCMSIFQLRCNRVHWKEFTTFQDFLPHVAYSIVGRNVFILQLQNLFCCLSEAAVFGWGCGVCLRLRMRCLSEAAVFVWGCGVCLRLRCLSVAAVFVWVCGVCVRMGVCLRFGVCLRLRCLSEAAVFVCGCGVCLRLRCLSEVGCLSEVWCLSEAAMFICGCGVCLSYLSINQLASRGWNFANEWPRTRKKMARNVWC